MTDSLIPAQRIERAILVLRGHKVILDADLAALYGVTTKRLNEQVRRNHDRFPPDFMFHLTRDEWAILRSQIAASSWGGRRTLPYAFTEHGALMAASVLNSPVAVSVSIEVVRGFMRLRQLLATHHDLAQKLAELEQNFEGRFQQHEALFIQVFEAIQQLMLPPDPPGRPIGFS